MKCCSIICCVLCVLALVSFRAEDFIFNIVILYTQKTTAKGAVVGGGAEGGREKREKH